MKNYEQLGSYGRYVSGTIKTFQLMAKGLSSMFVSKAKCEVLAENFGIQNIYTSIGIFGLVNKSAEDSDIDDDFANNLHATSLSLLENLETYLPAFYKRCAQYSDDDLLRDWFNEMEDHFAKIQEFVERKTSAQNICWCNSGNF